MSYLCDLLRLPRGQPLVERKLRFRVVAWFWPVTDEQLVFNRIVEVAS